MEDQAKKNAPQIKEVHEIRKGIQALINQLKENYNSRESSLTVTKLQEAKHWAGEMLGSLGSVLPAEYRDEAPRE